MTGRIPDIFEDGILPSVQRPARYIGGELNLLSRGYREGEYNILLAFPDVYELGMSYQGIHTLSRHLAELEGVNFEFLFAPWPDMQNMLVECGIPMPSTETGTSASDFDMIGFSLTYELHYSNMIRMLELAGILADSAERGEEDPLVVAGGPCVMNPLPVLESLDAVFLGDGEQSLPEAASLMRELKREGAGRIERRRGLAGVPGVYVDGVSESAAARKYITGSARSCSPPYLLPAIERGWRPPVPSTGIVHDRLIVEIQRGCTRGCRFCQAGILYRPCRERTVADVAASVTEGIEATGWEEVSLLSLSTSDYSEIEELAGNLIPALGRNRVSLAMPSLRPGTVTEDMIEALSTGKRTGFTIAPEAGTERLRRVINKKITDAEIIDCCRRILESGWRTLKLYFMIGLPTEREEDLEGIVRLIREVLAIRRKLKLNVTISPFVPKPHTPFQWEKQCGIDEIMEKERFLSQRLNDRRLNLQLRNPEVSVLEGILARGDRRLYPVIREAVRQGAGFEGWTEHFDFGIWKRALARAGIDPDELTGEIDPEKEVPWSKFRTGVTRKFLLEERERAFREELTEDCREGGCTGCGVCPSIPEEAGAERTAAASKIADKKIEPEAGGGRAGEAPVYYRYRCLYSRKGRIRFVSHRDMVDIIRRAVTRTGLPVCYSRGFHPQSKISFSPPLAVGMEGENEFFDLRLSERVDVEPESFSELLPGGITVKRYRGPFAGSMGKLPPEALFHYYLDFTLIRLIIESMDGSGDHGRGLEDYRMLAAALGLDEEEHRAAGGDNPAGVMKSRLDKLFESEEDITDRKGRKRSVAGCRTGSLNKDTLEIFLRKVNGVGITPADLLGRYLHASLAPLVKINRKGMYFKRGGEYLNPIELVS